MRTLSTYLSLVEVRKRRIMRSRWFFMLAVCCTVAFSSLVWVSPARAGRIVVANDDWTLSDAGFNLPNNPGTFALNVADWFTGGGPGNFLVYSDHMGLTGDKITSTMTGAGHIWTADMSVNFDVPTLLTYDGVFTGGFDEDEVGPNNQVLTDYVNAGGNVYVYSAGNPWDPDLWNDFLTSFGLKFGERLSRIVNIPINSSHAIFAGVDYLFTVNGSYIIDLDSSDPHNKVLVEFQGGGVYAVYDQPDDQGPVTWNVVANPNVAMFGGSVALTANVDDTTEGGSTIASAEYNLDGGSWTPMTAQDGTFDEISEDVSANFTAPSAVGVYNLCVRGTDAVGNVGNQECIMLVVYDPSAGFVTGGGWIDSPAGAYVPDPSLEGKANFGFVSKYKKGAEVPTGQTEFKFEVADLDFHSSSYDWLVVNQAGTNAQFKGAGTINDSGYYKFMLWAGDDPDTFRIKIWEEDEPGVETVKYDNGSEQAIAGGSIVIHVK